MGKGAILINEAEMLPKHALLPSLALCMFVVSALLMSSIAPVENINAQGVATQPATHTNRVSRLISYSDQRITISDVNGNISATLPLPDMIFPESLVLSPDGK